MRRLIDRLPVTAKIALISMLPLSAAMVFAAMELVALRGDVERTGRIDRIVAQTPALSATIHQLQSERGATSGYVNAGPEAFGAAMEAARTRVDTAFAEMETAIEEHPEILEFPEFSKPYKEGLRGLENLRATRLRVDNGDISATEVGDYYTPVIGRLLQAAESIADHADDPEIARQLIALGALLDGKEAAGMERAIGAAAFGGGGFDRTAHSRFVRLVGAQDRSWKEFGLYADAESADALTALLASPVAAEVDRLRTVAFGAPFGGSVADVTGIAWFKAATARIDALHEVELSEVSALRRAADHHAAAAENAFMRIALIAAVLVAVTGLIAFFVARSLRGGALDLTKVMGRLAEGESDLQVPGRERGDEIGLMARAVEVFRQNAIEKTRLEAEQEKAAERAEAERKQAMRDLADQFEEAVGQIVRSVSSAATELQAAAETMTSTVEETNTRSTAVASASEQASTNVQTVASAAEEMSSSIREIGRQAAESSSRAKSAETEADQTVANVEQLSATAERIGDVIALIQEIAEQTNLLALNATIEAARAGDAGKGFAVVASEVKSLANQTAKATTDISEQIQAIQNATGTSAEAIRKVTGAVKELNGIAATIASAVEEQTAVTQEIAQNVQQAASGTQDVSSNITGVTRAATESSSAATQVLSSAGELAQQAANLDNEMNSFLERVRAA